MSQADWIEGDLLKKLKLKLAVSCIPGQDVGLAEQIEASAPDLYVVGMAHNRDYPAMLQARRLQTTQLANRLSATWILQRSAQACE